MTSVQFLDIKPFVSCCKHFEIVFHIPSSIRASNKHYIALCELVKSSQFTWVWAGKTVPLEQEGITVKWRKGRVTFANHALPKLSDGREYYLMYCNEDGTILGESRAFQFRTESDEFSSIDLQSTPSDDVIMISMHGKNTPPTSSSEIVVHNINDDTASFEVISEQTYSDTIGPIEGSVAIIKGSSTKGDDKLLTSSYTHYYNVPMESNSSPESIQLLRSELVTMKAEVSRLKDEGTMKDYIIEELKTENAALKEQLAIQTLSNSTVLVNSPKEDREKKILKKRIQDEAKKSLSLEELLDHKEAKLMQLENETLEKQNKELKLHNVPSVSEEHEVITELFDKFYKTLTDIDEWIPSLVPRKIVSIETSARIQKASTHREKVRILMVECIAPPVKGGVVSILYHLLEVMENEGLLGTKELAAEIRSRLMAKKRRNQKLLELQHQLKHGDLDSEEKQLLEHQLLQIQHLKGSQNFSTFLKINS